MASDDKELNLPDLSGEQNADQEEPEREIASTDTGDGSFSPGLQPVYDVPVSVRAVIGRTRMTVAELMRLERGSVFELDRKVGEAIDIYVNSRLVARGEIVIVEEQLGVTMTEIITDK